MNGGLGQFTCELMGVDYWKYLSKIDELLVYAIKQQLQLIAFGIQEPFKYRQKYVQNGCKGLETKKYKRESRGWRDFETENTIQKQIKLLLSSFN